MLFRSVTNNFLYERIIVWFRNYTLQRDFISEILNRQKSNRQNGAVAGELQWCYVIGYCTYVNSVNILLFALFASCRVVSLVFY